MKKVLKISNNFKIFFILLIIILVGYFWINKLESYTERKKVDYPGNDIWYNPKDLPIPECLAECQNIVGCKGIVTNFREGTYNSQKNSSDSPKCWLKNRFDGTGNNTHNRFTYIL